MSIPNNKQLKGIKIMSCSYNGNRLKDALYDFNKAYAELADASRQDALRNLQPGAPAPAEGKILDEKHREQFKGKANLYRTQAINIIDGELKKINDKLSAAPSSEAVNVVQMLAAKKSTTTEEVENLLQRYGKNALTHDAITSIAADKGVHVFSDNTLHERVQQLEALRTGLNRSMTLADAERGLATKAYAAFIGMQIDEAFPEE